MGMGLNHTVYTLMIIIISYNIVISLEDKNRKIIYAPFGNGFLQWTRRRSEERRVH